MITYIEPAAVLLRMGNRADCKHISKKIKAYQKKLDKLPKSQICGWIDKRGSGGFITITNYYEHTGVCDGWNQICRL